jgi:hypothetical protein
MLVFPAFCEKRTRGSNVPSSWTANTNHTFGTGSAYIRTVAYGSDGYWVMVGGDSSGNGCVNYISGAPTGSWSEPTHGFGALDCRCLTYDGTNWCVGGYSQSFRYKASPPSGTWSSGTYVPGSTSIYGLDYGSGNWCVGCSGGAIYYKSSSVNGAWSTATETISGDIRALSYGSDTYWVTGGSNNNIATDSGTPSAFTSRTTPFGATDNILNAGYDGSTNWVVGSSDGDIAYSTDHGTTWTIVSNPGPFVNGEWINDVQYGNGIWVICGSNGKLATATDPTSAGNWTSQTSGFGTTLIRGINYGNGYWVAVGSSGVMTTSPVTV